MTKVQSEIKVLLVTKDRPSIQIKVKQQVTKVEQEIKVLLLTNMSINAKQGTISGDKCSTGNIGSIGDKGPSVNTEQGKISGDKVSTGNKCFIAD